MRLRDMAGARVVGERPATPPGTTTPPGATTPIIEELTADADVIVVHTWPYWRRELRAALPALLAEIT